MEWGALEGAGAVPAVGYSTLAVLLTLSGSPSSHSSSVTCVMFSTGLVRVRRTWLSWGDSGITGQEAVTLKFIITVSTSIFCD